MSNRRPLLENLGALASGRPAAMRPMDSATAVVLSKILTGIEPWSRLGSSNVALAQGLMAGREQSARSWCLTVDGEPSGAMVVRDNWLRGPYLAHLSVVPAQQRQGLGRLAIKWWEDEARRAGGKNLWLCVSSFNATAQQLYLAAGFKQVGVVDDLLVDGLDEILMRKRLSPAPD